MNGEQGHPHGQDEEGEIEGAHFVQKSFGGQQNDWNIGCCEQFRTVADSGQNDQLRSEHIDDPGEDGGYPGQTEIPGQQIGEGAGHNQVEKHQAEVRFHTGGKENGGNDGFNYPGIEEGVGIKRSVQSGQSGHPAEVIRTPNRRAVFCQLLTGFAKDVSAEEIRGERKDVRLKDDFVEKDYGEQVKNQQRG